MLAYLRYLVVDYLHQDGNAVPTHDILQLLTSDHVETFPGAFSSLDRTLDAIEEAEEEEEEEEEQAENHVASKQKSPPSTESIKAGQDVSIEAAAVEKLASPRVTGLDSHADESLVVSSQASDDRIPCDSPSRSDEGYGSSSGESLANHEHEHETKDEIAALGIIEEGDEVPDYGVALEPASFTSISPQKEPQTSMTLEGSTQDSSPTKARLANLSPSTPRAKRMASLKGGMSENARNLLTIGYTLSLMGEKLDKTRSVEGSVKSMMIKAGQAIEKSQAGSVYGKSRYGGSKYGGSRYAGSRYGGSKFGGSKRSVARSIVLEENLPAWGF